MFFSFRSLQFACSVTVTTARVKTVARHHRHETPGSHRRTFTHTYGCSRASPVCVSRLACERTIRRISSFIIFCFINTLTSPPAASVAHRSRASFHLSVQKLKDQFWLSYMLPACSDALKLFNSGPVCLFQHDNGNIQTSQSEQPGHAPILLHILAVIFGSYSENTLFGFHRPKRPRYLPDASISRIEAGRSTSSGTPSSRGELWLSRRVIW